MKRKLKLKKKTFFYFNKNFKNKIKNILKFNNKFFYFKNKNYIYNDKQYNGIYYLYYKFFLKNIFKKNILNYSFKNKNLNTVNFLPLFKFKKQFFIYENNFNNLNFINNFKKLKNLNFNFFTNNKYFIVNNMYKKIDFIDLSKFNNIIISKNQNLYQSLKLINYFINFNIYLLIIKEYYKIIIYFNFKNILK